MLKEVCFFMYIFGGVLCGGDREVRLVVVPFFVLIHNSNI